MSKAVKLSMDLIGYTVAKDLVHLPNGTKMIVPGENGTEHNQSVDTLDFSVITNNMHTIATEYRVSQMMAWFMLAMGKVDTDDILEIGNKFPHHTLSTISEFTKSHSRVSKYRIHVLKEHGLIRLGVDRINDCVVIAPTVPCTAVKTNWLKKRWSDLGTTISDIITDNVLKDNKEVMSVFQLIIIEVANLITGILATIDKHLDTDLISEFEEQFFKHSTLKKDKAYIHDYYGDYDIEPRGEDMGAILTGMPDTKSNSYCIKLHKGIAVLLSDIPVKEVEKPTVKEVEKPTVKEVEKPTVLEVEKPTVADTTRSSLFGKTGKGKLTSNRVTRHDPKPQVEKKYIDQYGNPCDKQGNPLGVGAQHNVGTAHYVKPETLPPRSNGVQPQANVQQYAQQPSGYGVSPQVQQYPQQPNGYVQPQVQQSNGYGVQQVQQSNGYGVQQVQQYTNPYDGYGVQQQVQQYGKPSNGYGVAPKIRSLVQQPVQQYTQQPNGYVQPQVNVQPQVHQSNGYGNPYPMGVQQQFVPQYGVASAYDNAKSSLINSLLSKQ